MPFTSCKAHMLVQPLGRTAVRTWGLGGWIAGPGGCNFPASDDFWLHRGPGGRNFPASDDFWLHRGPDVPRPSSQRPLVAKGPMSTYPQQPASSPSLTAPTSTLLSSHSTGFDHAFCGDIHRFEASRYRFSSWWYQAERMTALPQFSVALDATSPFIRQLALQRGLSDADLRSWRYQRIFHGIYISSSVQVTTKVRAAAALTVSPPGSFASHHTAVRLWGGIPPESPLTHVSLPGPGVRCVRQGIISHRGLPGAQLSRRFALPISTPVQAFIELAAVGTNLVDLVVAGDSLVKAARILPEAFVNAADEWTGRGA
jgi:hypothetical protein